MFLNISLVTSHNRLKSISLALIHGGLVMTLLSTASSYSQIRCLHRKILFWLGEDTIFKNKFVLSYDFTENPAYIMFLSVVREEKLSLLYWSLRVSYMEVWMTNEIDGTQAALWSKSFTVKNPNNLIPCFMSFLVDEEKKLVLGCNSAFGGDHIKKLYTTGEDSGYSTEIPSVGSKHKTLSPFIFSYVPSLVQIQQGGSNETNNTS